MPLDQDRIRALCFDVDGTLRDTDDQYVQRLAGWLHMLRFLFPGQNPQPFARRMVMKIEDPATFLHGLPDRLHIDHHLVRLSCALRQRRRDWRRYSLRRKPSDPPAQNFLIISGVTEMLAVLHRRYPMSIITARDEESTLTFLDHFKLTDYFQAVASGQTCRYTKPFPDPLLWAAHKMGVSPAACLMIGDTTVDIRAGKAAGAQTAGVLCGFGEEAELRRAGADLILPTTPDLISRLSVLSSPRFP